MIKIIKRSINDYTIILINREKKSLSFLRIEWSLFVKNWVHFTQEYIVSSLARILGQWFDVEDFVNVIFTSCWKRTLSIIWTTLNPHLPQDILCQSLVNLKHSTSLREIYILFTSNSLSLRTILFLNVILLYMLVVFYKKT